MMMPNLTADERKAALEKAMASRQMIAQLKRDLVAGEKTFEDAFAMRKESAIGRMKVLHLIQTLPSVGVNRAESIMKEARIALSRRLSGLSVRQMEELLEIEKRYRPE